MITLHPSLCHEAWQMLVHVLSTAWVKLAFSLSTRAGCISKTVAWRFWLSDTVHWLGHVEVRAGRREAELVYLVGVPKVSLGLNKATGSHEILQQCLTEEETLVLFLDKRINKIKRLSKHQWKIACHFDSALKHEAGASSSFHLTCSAIIPALNGDGCHSAQLLSYCVARQTPMCRHFPLYAATWVSSPQLPVSTRWKKSGNYFSHFICIIVKGVKWVSRAEDHDTCSAVDRIQRAQCTLVCKWAVLPAVTKKIQKDLC